MITSIVLTKNEGKRLPNIFENLKRFSEIIVFDDSSTDDTKQVCENYGVQFVTRPPELMQSYRGEAYQWAMSQVKTPYVLLVNCSHHHPLKLLDAYKSVANEGVYHAVYNDIVIYSYGSIVHRPFFRRRSSGCNFFKLDAINFDKGVIHNEVPVDLPPNLVLRLEPSDELSVHLFRDYDLKKTELTHGRYSEAEAKQRFEQGLRTSYFKMLFKPFYRFLYQYIRCGSMLRRSPGLMYALQGAYLELSIQMRLWEMEHNLDLQRVSELHLKIRAKMNSLRS